MNIYLLVSVLAVFIIAVFTDVLKRKIPDILSLALLGIGTVNCVLQGFPLYFPLIHGGVVLILYLTIALLGDVFLQRKGIKGCALGGGDVKFMSAFAYVAGAVTSLIVAWIAFLLAYLYTLVKTDRSSDTVISVPMAPFFLGGLIIYLFCPLF